MVYDVIIIGLGPAGISAAIYAKRSGMNIAVINLASPGGMINESSVVENYPGFKKISGQDLAFKFFEHFNSLNIPLFNEEVIDIKDGDIKTIFTKKDEYKAKKIIICSGRKPKKLNLKDEEKFIGNGISYCSICDGNLYKNKTVAVVGGGNSALESAIYLSGICKSVFLIVRNSNFKGSKILVDKVNEKNNIIIKFDTSIKEILIKDAKIAGIKTFKEEIFLNGIFIHIGYEPSIGLLKSLNIKMDQNYIIVDKNMETSVKGIYACGDIIKKDLYQIVTAVSEGAIAATHCYKNIKHQF